MLLQASPTVFAPVAQSFFDDYVSDLHAFITTVVRKDAPTHLFLVAHSLGGAVATLYADAHPEGLSGLALSAPMLDIQTTGFPAFVASTLSLTACSASDGTAYVLGAGDYDEVDDFAGNNGTSSRARYDWHRQLGRDDRSLAMGGVTWRWLCVSLAASSAAQALGRYSPVYTLMLQAGVDKVVNPGGQDLYCGDAPRCQLSRFPEGNHELFHERDELRNEAVSQVVKFLDARSAP